MLALRNKYLVTRSGRFVGSRGAIALLTFGPMIGSPFLFVGVALVGDFIGGALTAIGLLASVAFFFVPVILAWIWLFTGGKSVENATWAWRQGDLPRAIELCQKPLGTVFRADIRTRALYVLGLVAESNGDFAEAADLFDRASSSMPAFAAANYQRYARCLMLSHRALALVALGRLDEADFVVRNASALFPPVAGGVFDALTNDAAFGAIGVSAALRQIEQGRDHRALVTLASATVLAARGFAREALELLNQERYTINAGLSPRERALAANVEARAQLVLSGGPMRAPGAIVQASDPWADRILPARV